MWKQKILTSKIGNPKYITRIVLLFAFFNSSVGCTSYQYSNKTGGEETTITPFVYEEPLSLAQIVEQNNPDVKSRSLVTTDMLVQGANLAIQGVKYLIDESKKKYHAEYFSGFSNQYFYGNNSSNGMLDPEGIKFRGFTFERSFTDKETGENVAVTATFSLDESKLEDIYFKSKFYLKLDSIDVRYSKVKVNDTKWYLPWTWFLKKQKTFNMDLDMELKANWIDESGAIHSDVAFGHFILPLRHIPLNPNDPDRIKYFEALKGSPVIGSSYIIPRSVTYCTNPRGQSDMCYGRGDFSITLKAVESSKEDLVTKLLQDNSDQIFDQLKGKDVIKMVKPRR